MLHNEALLLMSVTSAHMIKFKPSSFRIDLARVVLRGGPVTYNELMLFFGFLIVHPGGGTLLIDQNDTCASETMARLAHGILQIMAAEKNQPHHRGACAS